MHDALAFIGSGLLDLYGFGLLALSQERHFEAVYGSIQSPGPRRNAPRATGFLAIGLALPVCIAGQGTSFGSLLWLVLMSAAAMAIALTLTWRPSWLRLLTFGIRPFSRPGTKD